MMDSITSRKRQSSVPPALYRWGAALFWLLVWQGTGLLLGQPLLLPTPLQVAARLVELAVTPDFWLVTAGSLLRIMTGFFLGLAAGSLLAVVTSVSRLARAVAELPMGIIKATPVASFAILALLFIRGGGFSVFISFLMVLPVVWSNLATGIDNTDPKLLEMARVYRFTRWRTVRRVYLPSVTPYLLAAARTGIGFAWKSGIAGEVIAIPPGSIGTQLYNSKVYLETADLFAWTATVIILSLLLEKVLVRLALRLEGGSRL